MAERNKTGRETGVQALLEIGKIFRGYMKEAEEHEDPEVFNGTTVEDRISDFLLYMKNR